MAHRAAKYAQLFIVMTYALWWLFEIVGVDGVDAADTEYLHTLHGYADRREGCAPSRTAYPGGGGAKLDGRQASAERFDAVVVEEGHGAVIKGHRPAPRFGCLLRIHDHLDAGEVAEVLDNATGEVRVISGAHCGADFELARTHGCN